MMWVFLNDAFVSAVEHRDDKNLLMVRARFEGDLQRVFPRRADQVLRTPNADYLFRVVVTKQEFADVMFDEASAGIDYGNFKGSVKTMPRHDVYLDVWHVMLAAQRKYQNKKGWV
jgi:hypothetical protein